MSTDSRYEADPLVVDNVNRILSDTCTPEAIEHAEQTGWASTIWDPMAQAGFPWVGVPESIGGSGGSFADTAAILRAVGRHAAPIPVGETGVLAAWTLGAAGLEIPNGPATAACPWPEVIRVDNGRVIGMATVAWAQVAQRIVTIAAHDDGSFEVVSVTPDQVAITAGTNLAGEPRDIVTFDIALDATEHAPSPPGWSPFRLLEVGAFTRTQMAAGALARIADMTVDYTLNRQQFGKPVASFQLVQRHLMAVAQCSVRATMAADTALRALTDFQRVDTALTVARVVIDEAIAEGTRSAHQAHGAMGVTREYPLHQFTRRLWAWQHEYGSTAMWRRHLGRAAYANGADGLFPFIAG